MIWSIRNFWRSEIVRDVWNYNWWTEIWWLSSWPRFTVSTFLFCVVMAPVIIIISSASSSLTHSRHTKMHHTHRQTHTEGVSCSQAFGDPANTWTNAMLLCILLHIWNLTVEIGPGQTHTCHSDKGSDLRCDSILVISPGESIYPLKWVEGIRNVRFSLQTPRNLQQDPLNGPLNLGI